jgi:L-histidine Nalpha-methyltransferase
LSTPLPEGLTIDRYLPADFLASTLRADVLRGLTDDPKWLPPKWFYDQRGSELFEEITKLPEYYPTRAEREILVERAPQIAAATAARTLIELGSGSAVKTQLLLDALSEHGTLRRYVPVDVSESALLESGHALRARYPDLAIQAIVSDFEHGLPLPSVEAGPRLIVFLGGTIGNLPPVERAAFLGALRPRLGEHDALLLGTDLVKDPATLVAAYDDSAGITAAFNKNVLSVLNRELGADFDPDAFEHVAIWDPEAEWIEMRLRSTVAQTVKLPAVDLAVTFGAGEELRTEISAKFRSGTIEAELAAAGFVLREWWTDSAHRFGLSLSTPAA